MNIRSSSQAKACDIPAKVKGIVWERDKHRCILCADPDSMPNAHFVSRAHGGLGIPENIVTLCRRCHNEYDHGTARDYYGDLIERYLKKIYPGWNRGKVVFQNRWTNGPSCEDSSQKNITP